VDGTPQPVFTYAATVVSVYDGDTATLLIDGGFSCFRKEKVRLLRIDAPELTGQTRSAGLASRDYLRSLLPFGSPCVVTTIKDKQEKYGRYLAELYGPDGKNVSDLMVHAGHAVYREY
jgi:micrococcal nuclease